MCSPLSSGGLAQPGGERRTVSILLLDLPGFTGATERLGHRAGPLPGECSAATTKAIEAERGAQDECVGDAATPKGKRETIAVCEPFAMRDDLGAAPAGFAWRAAFEAGRMLRGDRRWRDAAEKFRAVLAARPDDGTAAACVAACGEHRAAQARRALASERQQA